MAKPRQLDKLPEEQKEEEPYAEYVVRFYDNKIVASFPRGIERLSVGKMQRSQRFLFREFGQLRRRLYNHVTKDNAERLAAFRKETQEKEQADVR